MKKISTVFTRNFAEDPSLVTKEQNPDCAWVFAGEGIGRRKFDGTSCMFDGSAWWKRREVKPESELPPGFLLETTDETTGKRTGWVPVEPADKWHLEGIGNTASPHAGTYELCGPKVQGNPEGFDRHVMVRHDTAEAIPAPRTFVGMMECIRDADIEGIVFHHADGRMAKIKGRDFGIRRKKG